MPKSCHNSRLGNVLENLQICTYKYGVYMVYIKMYTCTIAQKGVYHSPGWEETNWLCRPISWDLTEITSEHNARYHYCWRDNVHCGNCDDSSTFRTPINKITSFSMNFIEVSWNKTITIFNRNVRPVETLQDFNWKIDARSTVAHTI